MKFDWRREWGRGHSCEQFKLTDMQQLSGACHNMQYAYKSFPSTSRLRRSGGLTLVNF